MNTVLIIPTGVGADIGGHAGDANPVCKLLASISDTLITHPNVVNASDINEMPDNVFYVEGSLLDRFLRGEVKLKQPKQNRILVVANPPIRSDTVNAVSAARVTIGIDVSILELDTSLRMVAHYDGDVATGDVYGWEQLVDQVKEIDYDALAIHTPIEVPRDVALGYYRNGGVNPWGGVEAVASKIIANAIDKPVAHAPLESVTSEDPELYNVLYETVDPRIAPEAISYCYLHCVLKGLNRAPRVAVEGMSIEDIDVAIFPHGCFGEPHIACLQHKISVVIVGENKTVYNNEPHTSFICVDNYWEAAGIIACMKAGVALSSVRRPMRETEIRRS